MPVKSVWSPPAGHYSFLPLPHSRMLRYWVPLSGMLKDRWANSRNRFCGWGQHRSMHHGGDMHGVVLTCDQCERTLMTERPLQRGTTTSLRQNPNPSISIRNPEILRRTTRLWKVYSRACVRDAKRIQKTRVPTKRILLYLSNGTRPPYRMYPKHVPKTGSYICPFYEQVFTRRNYLNRHMQLLCKDNPVHSGLPPHRDFTRGRWDFQILIWPPERSTGAILSVGMLGARKERTLRHLRLKKTLQECSW